MPSAAIEPPICAVLRTKRDDVQKQINSQKPITAAANAKAAAEQKKLQSLLNQLAAIKSQMKANGCRP